MIEIENLCFSYTNTHGKDLKVFDNLSLKVETESYATIVGPSGCGKSTLLFIISGLIENFEGSVYVDDLHPQFARKNHILGYVFQKPVFFEWLSIKENVLVPNSIQGENKPSEAEFYLNKFRLSGFEDNYPHELSGGMLSRVSLARALVSEPKFLLLDEAFNNLDESLREEINDDIQRIWMEKKNTVLAVTHNIDEAVYMSDKVFLLTQKPAKVAKCYDIPFSRPRNSNSLRTNESFIKIVNDIRKDLQNLYK